MQQYLQIRCGAYHLLVAATGVLEVLDFSEKQQRVEESHGCRLWRGSSIGVMHLQALMADDGSEVNPPRAALVYSAKDAEHPVMILCDMVIGLLQADEHSFRPLPLAEARLNRYFDKVLPEVQTGHMLLRLTRIHTDQPFDPEANIEEVGTTETL